MSGATTVMTIVPARVLGFARRFGSDTGGGIAIIFALGAVVLIVASGGGIDLMRSYQAKQKLSEIATLTCQYASRPSVLQLLNGTGGPGATSYQATVDGYIDRAVTTQKMGWTLTNTDRFVQSGTGPADVKLAVAVPTAFARIIGITQLPVTAAAHCYDGPNAPDPSGFVVKEGFEATGGANAVQKGGWAYYTIDGRSIARPSANPGSTPVYTGTGSAVWYGTGYCLETDEVGTISSTVPEGRQSAELDCENGSGRAGNSAISTKVDLRAGNQELRYFYRSRVTYRNYDPAYLCGSTAGDLSWANDTASSGGPVPNVSRTNQINVYLDAATAGANAPLHRTLDGRQELAGANLIDSCVYAPAWIERSVRIFVSTPGSYWLTFAADGQDDSYGGQIDSIRLCNGTCPDALQDNFPAAWAGGGKVLFADSFESPTYAEDVPRHGIAKGGNLALSRGSTGGSPLGWPAQDPSGWTTAPVNQVNYGTLHNGQSGASQGSQYVLLDGWSASGSADKNRKVMRPFLLDPGYYRVSYGYISIVDLSGAGVTGTSCQANPASGAVYPADGAGLTGTIRHHTTLATGRWTNLVGVFMSNGQLISTPVPGASQGAATSFRNPDGSLSATPAVPPDRVDWQRYDAGAVNPVIDTCGYADSFRWVPRTASVKITKPGIYWLTFSANGGTADGNGGGIDDVKVTALGGPYLANPPGNTTTIPVPDPQPGTRIYFTGFSIVADPFAPTAPLQ
ncbi:hypothetical protein ASF39_10310 [Methylobacterium sp. Leaf108]|nr:hypothetical protein ASF39_10310 [Methylobacterium sp. Leaf108]